MSRIVIAAHRPKSGKAQELLHVVRRHRAVLEEEGLVAERPRIVMQAADGTLVEVFEWRSAEAIERAHASPAVHALWEEFAAACDHVPIGAVAEAGKLFSEFAPVDL